MKAAKENKELRADNARLMKLVEELQSILDETLAENKKLLAIFKKAREATAAAAEATPT